MTTPQAGRWQVTTETSVYLLDLDDGHVTRVPDAGAGNADRRPPVAIAVLRRDHEPIKLLEVMRCEVGLPMQLVLDVRRDGLPTLRTSTRVRDLRRLRG